MALEIKTFSTLMVEEEGVVTNTSLSITDGAEK